ncbi:zinc-dependent metalloprotease [Ruania halotolerans]|uniref:zinc-dependent metalloprotease n=1 Tax=Ruania halotolerans TaxID=2897773 RepID=UPI001E642773|nr:zinc-dependent metalloprotease [Ruania halotolerans]UFU05559.1 zinc-dependent metalloprotease [Ruania halotolerans]
MSEDSREQWRQMLEQMLGKEGADEAMRAFEASGIDPGQLGGTGFGSDPAQLQAAMAQMQQLLAAGNDGDSHWKMAHDVARQVAHTGGDPAVSAADAEQIRSALTVADLWLDAATELPPSGGSMIAASRAEWVERTLPTWRAVAEPVGTSVAEALATLLDPERLGPDGEHGAPGMPELPFGGMDITAMMRTLGSASFAMQVGQGAGTLAREVFGGTDVGLPLLREPGLMMVPANVREFADGLDAPEDEVRHFLAVREAAHARLFAHVPWLRAHLLGAVEQYAQNIDIDLDQMEEAVRSIDATDVDQLRQALSAGIFVPKPTPTQAQALLRLETALALVEGWVEEVTAAAVAPHLPHGVPLREMLRRRRAAGGPAEDTFQTLVGLELRPRRARDASTLWALVAREQGTAARDRLWSHPDVFPTDTDLDAPSEFLTKRAAEAIADSEMDAALAAMLDGESDSRDGHGEDEGR